MATEVDYDKMTLEQIRDTYGMFTLEGGKEVAELVESVKKLPITTTDEELYKHLRHGMKSIAKIGHREVYDTDVREQIIYAVEKSTGRELSIFEV